MSSGADLARSALAGQSNAQRPPIGAEFGERLVVVREQPVAAIRERIAAIAADNYAVELNPSRDQCDCCAYLPLHEHCIFKLGMPLGELWYLTALAAWLRDHGRSRFLLTAPPLRLPGSVGTPLTPVATV